MNYRRMFVMPMIIIMVSILYLSDTVIATAASELSIVVPELDAAEEAETGASVSENNVVPAAHQDFVSTGEEFMAWMESHKNTGGSVRLTNHVSLDQSYVFIPTVLQPTDQLIVDTAGYTVTVTGEVELWSNGLLTFIGNANAQGMLHVAAGGMLDMHGVNVEAGHNEAVEPTESASGYALWQEEGAGLALDNCRVSGNIHYAQTLFVMYDNYVYAIAEKGQTAADVLPVQINCEVNYQGAVSDRQMPVEWNLEGTQMLQEERLRFVVQGSFVNGASSVPPVCTMVYNDYPLTFTEVKASAGNGFYSFKGSYTRPKEYVPMTIITEYSFDGNNWLVDEEHMVSDIDEPANFIIGFSEEESSGLPHSYVYIRLRGEHGGICYFSNVLCYAADSLAMKEEIGGGRGGGTSVVNPSDTPEREPADTASEQTETNSTGSVCGNTGGDDTDSHDTVGGGMDDHDANSHNDVANHDHPADTDAIDAKPSERTQSDTKPSQTGSSEQEAKQRSVEHSGIQTQSGIDKSADGTETTRSEQTLVAAQKESQEHTEPLHRASVSFGSVALGFVIVSILAGAAGVGIHAGIFHRAFYAVRKVWFK